jgi:hypothetical protein
MLIVPMVFSAGLHSTQAGAIAAWDCEGKDAAMQDNGRAKK